MIETLWWLLVAHFIGDWGLQNRWMAENKSKWYEILVAHCMIYTGCISIALEYLDKFSIDAVLFVFFSHLIVDMLSSKSSRNVSDRTMQLILWLDHTGHFACLYLISTLF